MDLKNNITISFNMLDLKDAYKIKDSICDWAETENLGCAVTRSIVTHVLCAIKNNHTNIDSLKNVRLVVGNKQYMFSGEIKNGLPILKKELMRS